MAIRICDIAMEGSRQVTSMVSRVCSQHPLYLTDIKVHESRVLVEFTTILQRVIATESQEC
jgi:hypothetical protein